MKLARTAVEKTVKTLTLTRRCPLIGTIPTQPTVSIRIPRCNLPLGNELQQLWEIKRRGGDSNPRYCFQYTAFPVLHNRPLCHLSGNRIVSQNTGTATGWLPGLPRNKAGTLLFCRTTGPGQRCKVR